MTKGYIGLRYIPFGMKNSENMKNAKTCMFSQDLILVEVIWKFILKLCKFQKTKLILKDGFQLANDNPSNVIMLWAMLTRFSVKCLYFVDHFVIPNCCVLLKLLRGILLLKWWDWGISFIRLYVVLPIKSTNKIKIFLWEWKAILIIAVYEILWFQAVCYIYLIWILMNK